MAALALAWTTVVPTVGAAEPRIGSTPVMVADHAAPADASGAIEGEILIRYARDTTPGQRVEIERQHGLTRVRAATGGRTEVVRADGRATATVRRTLAADPRVVAVAPNARRELTDDISGEPAFAEQWGLHNTGQTLVGTTTETGIANVDIDGLQALADGLGSPGVVVAVVDDGVDFSHPDLAARAWTNPGEAGPLAANGIDDDGNGYVDDVHGWDFCNGDNTVHDAGQDGHGTHVAGTIAASLDGQGVVGVAPGVSIMALKFIDDSLACGSDDMAVAAIDYAASFGVRIINASWGGPEASSVLDATIGESRALFVAAAGNGGSDLDQTTGPRFYPASSTMPNVLAVAAVDQSGRLASFSNFGATTVDLAAPGTNILSTYPADVDCPSPCYAWSAGTSMAAPHVSGVAALALSHQPIQLASAVSLRNRLLATGRPLATIAGRTTTGRLVNALRAIDTGKPVVHAPDRYGFAVGSAIGGPTVVTLVRWPVATDAQSGITGYDLRRRGPDGWTQVGRGLVDTRITSSLRFGRTYRFRLSATDEAGNVGWPVDGPDVTPTLYGDGSRLATYGTGWSTVASTKSTGGTLHTARRSGAWMAFRFTGRSVAIVAPRGASRGAVKVYVDGAFVSTVSLYRPTARARVIVFARSWPDEATHTVKLVVVGTAGHPRVDVDGFAVLR